MHFQCVDTSVSEKSSALCNALPDPIDDPVDDACGGAVDEHRAGDGEHLRAGAEDDALCLCQDRTHNFFAFLEFYDSVQL